eukprot:gene20365-22373_t
MIDAHCHLSAEEFNSDREEVIFQAKEVGVKGIIAVCEFPTDFQNVIDLAARFPNFVFPCLGVHPVQIGCKSVSLKEFDEAELWIRKYSEDLVGIGEIGLDFTPRYINSPEDKDIQRDVFKKQSESFSPQSNDSHSNTVESFVKNFKINVHSRSAGRPVIEMLLQEGAENVVLHAFDGRPSVAMRGVDAGYFFSVPACILRSDQKQRIVKQIPLSNLLLETDAPALGPEKQGRNEPKNIIISCEEIARIKNISIDDVISETSANAGRLFSKIPR